VILGTQYYRAPFPESRYWDDDFRRIKDSGLTAVQLWVVWAWVEPQPGAFQFGDYDRLMELADKHGLRAVLSTIAEIHPYWIHRDAPGSEMIDSAGNKVVSSNRVEVHHGLTPGGCFDHPRVWDRMATFLARTVERYRGAAPLVGWDAWNEIRWNVQADGAVCYCEHTIAKFRAWLDARYGGLAGLNEAWKRRYACWDDVLPGKTPDRPYTELMAFTHFLTERTNAHARARYDVMKALDPSRPITVHGAFPSATWPGTPDNQVLNRGNDWDFADHLDGVGCSSFPKWQEIDDADFGIRVEMVRAAAGTKQVWLSEVQGGRAALAYMMGEAVDPDAQQRWIWNGLACGADAILFWCWRDEVFGRESGGFGIAGADGYAEARIAALQRTGRLLRDHAALFDAYKPQPPEVGVLFSPQSYYLNWAAEGSAERAVNALLGYARALVRKSIPFDLVEEAHLDSLDAYRILFLPRTLALSDEVGERLARYVRNGGTLVCESECGAFGPEGIYRYPEDRFTTKLTGLAEVGRRPLPGHLLHGVRSDFDWDLPCVQWITPWQRGDGDVWWDHDDGAVIQRVPVGEGAVVLCGAYLGEAYRQRWSEGFESFVELLVRQSGWAPGIEVVDPVLEPDRFVYARHGASGGRRVLFLFAPPETESVTLQCAPDFFSGDAVTDLISGERCELETDEENDSVKRIRFTPNRWDMAVLVDEGIQAE